MKENSIENNLGTTMNRPASERALSNLEAIASGKSFVETYRQDMERRKRMREDMGYIRLLSALFGDDLSEDNFNNDCNIRA